MPDITDGWLEFATGLYDITAIPGSSCAALMYVPLAKRTLVLPYTEQDMTTVLENDVVIVEVVVVVVVDGLCRLAIIRSDTEAFMGRSCNCVQLLIPLPAAAS